MTVNMCLSNIPYKSMDKQNVCVSLISAYYFAPLTGIDRLPMSMG